MHVQPLARRDSIDRQEAFSGQAAYLPGYR